MKKLFLQHTKLVLGPHVNDFHSVSLYYTRQCTSFVIPYHVFWPWTVIVFCDWLAWFNWLQTIASRCLWCKQTLQCISTVLITCKIGIHCQWQILIFILFFAYRIYVICLLVQSHDVYVYVCVCVFNCLYQNDLGLCQTSFYGSITLLINEYSKDARNNNK